ncbi:MAG: acyltransferase family protein [Lachnospiraceae bacterium]|nr:acyltransferase family protein [Lachnospiraceae bacterium]
MIGAVGALLFTHNREQAVLNPDLSAWESRITTYTDGKWHADEALYPDDAEEGSETDLIYGPFFALPAGCYSVSVDYSCDADQTFAVYSFRNGNRILRHEPEILPAGGEQVTYHFTLLGSVDDLEIRMHYNGTGNLDIRNINVVPSAFLLRETFIVLVLVCFILNICLLIIYKKRTEEAESSREIWIDLCRGSGMLLVLLGHTEFPFVWLIFGFHMPLFFILSGYLYTDKTDGAAYIRKLFRRYMIPYFLLCGINLVITLVKTAIDTRISIPMILGYLREIVYAGKELPDCLPLWFLPALFLTMTGMYFLHRIGSKALRAGIVLLCAVTVALMAHFECPDLPWTLGPALIGLVFAETGYLIRQYDLIRKIDGIRLRDKIPLLLVILVCGIHVVKLNGSVSVRSMKYGHFPLWICGAVLLSVFVMAVSCGLCRKRALTAFLPVIALGRNTLLFFAFDFCMWHFSNDILQALLHYHAWYHVFLLKLTLLILVQFAWYYGRRMICRRKQ